MEDPIPKPLIIYQTDFNINFIKMKKMKKIILSCLCVFASTFTYCQSSNLGFNQVLNYNYSVSPSSSNSWISASTFTVPSGKVYKITSGSAYRINSGQDKLDYSGIKVDENIVYLAPGSTNGFAVSLTPIWLSGGSQGTTYDVYLFSPSNSSGTLKGSLSIVEFNVE